MKVTDKAVQTRVVGDGMLLLKRQFEQWRAGRVVGQRIPAQLWDGAVSAVAEHGACRVSGELHLECVVEMDNARGAKMRVELGGNALAASLSVLCSAFWSAP